MQMAGSSEIRTSYNNKLFGVGVVLHVLQQQDESRRRNVKKKENKKRKEEKETSKQMQV